MNSVVWHQANDEANEKRQVIPPGITFDYIKEIYEDGQE